jgi:hypothetical protein
MSNNEKQLNDCELEIAMCKAEISKLENEIYELNASLVGAYRIILSGEAGSGDSFRDSAWDAKPPLRIRLFYRLGLWLKGTKAKSIFLKLPSSLQSPLYSIARKIGLV